MEKSVLIKGDNYDIPGVLSYTETANKMPAVILCHGTGAQKNEVGNLFAILAEKLLQRGIASIRIDYAGCGDSKADQRQLTFLGEVEDTKRTCQYICGLKYIDQKNIGILGFSQGARVVAELLKEMQEFTPSVIRIVGRSGFADEITMVQAMRSDFTPALEDVLKNISDKDAVRLLETLEKYKKAAMFIVESLEQTLDQNMADQVGNTGKSR